MFTTRIWNRHGQLLVSVTSNTLREAQKRFNAAHKVLDLQTAEIAQISGENQWESTFNCYQNTKGQWTLL
jgi:hypothetical protein